LELQTIARVAFPFERRQLLIEHMLDFNDSGPIEVVYIS
jgi:hypothetical protein